MVHMKEEFYHQLMKLLKAEQIRKDEPLAKHTTFQIGGPARFVLLPETVEQVADLIKLCKEKNMPYYIIGNGSNLLVSDQGYDGTVIKISQALSSVTIEEKKSLTSESEATNLEKKQFIVRAQAGILLSKLANVIAENDLTGFEFASGIPGTLGGAVTMNAGAYDGEIKDSILEALVVKEDGEIVTLSKEELKLDYRKSIIQEKNYIVLEAAFLFEKGNKEAILEKMKDLNARRREKQPLEYPSAGSTFKRPKGFYAGKLIMDSGLQGYQYGNAQVSEKHCGFVINKGGATAEEVRTLINHVIQVVYDKFGVVLEPEVRFLGDF